ncbi:MAG: LytTR family transcriptional regulator DNA-binding domain-containing protein [Lachnospiraceae bacterium]|nr:LytTR family transcriptional regulator DNA-binding domain-containing protein [Lachnospiraceae bacterium]
MTEKDQTITVMVNRKECKIPVSSIVYAQVKDKLCTIFLYNAPPIRIFLTMNALSGMLSADPFLKISRGCLISMDYYQHMDDTDVVLTDNIRIPYSRRHKAQIRSAILAYQAANVGEHDNLKMRAQVLEEFRGFDTFPLPFCVLEAVPWKDSSDHSTSSQIKIEAQSPSKTGTQSISRTETQSLSKTGTQSTSKTGTLFPSSSAHSGRYDSGSRDFVLRYANDAFAAYVNFPAYQLINRSFFSLFEKSDPKWAHLFAECALKNQTVDALLPNQREGAALRVFCYQPHYSFCACMLMSAQVKNM